MHDLQDTVRRALVERQLVSRAFLSAGEHAAVLLRRDETVCVMINEEDHLRIHALLPGEALEETSRMAFGVESAIGKKVPYAFDAELGFLTSSPMNAGTGMRATVLLHLPALTRTGASKGVMQEMTKMGFFLRPMFGEDGEPQGELFLLGNQASLGRSEAELLASIESAAHDIVDRERTARELLLLPGDLALEDRLMRSVGILRYARRLPEPEWMRRWSDVRLAVQAGMLSMELPEWDALLGAVRPAHLELAAGKELSPQERDEERARLVRQTLLA